MTWISSILLLVLFGADFQGVPAPPEQWENLYRINSNVVQGVPCRATPDPEGLEVKRFFLKEPFMVIGAQGEWLETMVGETKCYLPDRKSIKFHERQVYCPPTRVDQPLLPIDDLVTAPFDPDALQPLGKLFPTFYMIAREEIYALGPNEKLQDMVDKKGKLIKKVAPLFRKAVMYQGTARLADGRIVHIGKLTKKYGRTFTVLPPDLMGHGVNGYRVYPYRSAAVDFDYLCTQFPKEVECDREIIKKVRAGKIKRGRDNLKQFSGMLLFIPRLMGVKMRDGSIHDGYVCAVDVGGGIKNDRIDLFVGMDGGGNPYYPPCRYNNPFINAGIRSLVPWDWRTWDRVSSSWKRRIQDEYRLVSPEKGLDVFLVKGASCKKKVTK
jgi:hypothetical protein